MKKPVTLTLILLCAFFIQAVAQERAPKSDAMELPDRKELLIPNAFTPNNDGQNDYFKIKNFSNQKLIEFKVFNRWGTILFQTRDPNEGWDGSYKNQKQPVGVYGYVIRIAYPEGVVETYKGTVTLLR